MGASGSAWHLALVWSPAPTYEHSSFPREGFGSDNPKKKKKKKNILRVRGHHADRRGWQFAIASGGNGSELQKLEFNLDAVENFVTSQDIKPRSE